MVDICFDLERRVDMHLNNYCLLNGIGVNNNKLHLIISNTINVFENLENLRPSDVIIHTDPIIYNSYTINNDVIYNYEVF